MKKVITILFVAAFVVAAVLPMAASAQDKDPVKDPVKDTARYTGNVVTGSVETVAEAAKGTTETAVSPIVAFWRSITGQGKPGKIITDPVEKGGKTVYDATVNTGKSAVGQKN